MKKILAMAVVFVFGVTVLAFAEGKEVKVESTSSANSPTEDPTVREAILQTIAFKPRVLTSPLDNSTAHWLVNGNRNHATDTIAVTGRWPAVLAVADPPHGP